MKKENVKLYCGDCLDVMKKIPDKSVDMILCDLPYGATMCKWDVTIPFEPLWKEYNRIIKDGACVALFGSEPFSSYLRISNVKKYKYDWKWNKTVGGNPFNNKIRPAQKYEDVLIFNSKFYFPIMENAKQENIRPISNSKQKTDLLNKFKKFEQKSDPSKRFPTNELIFSSRNQECNSLNRVHPTQKPVALLEYLIKTYTLEGETVLDNCMGSGSTGVACINTNRKFIGIEKEEKYFKIAKERIEAAAK
jgi:site-specific DNA-methyltransferase (adenine-specific)